MYIVNYFFVTMDCWEPNSKSLTGGYSLLWHRVVVPAHQPILPRGPVRQTYARVDYIPQSGTKNLASGIAQGSVNNFLHGHFFAIVGEIWVTTDIGTIGENFIYLWAGLWAVQVKSAGPTAAEEWEQVVLGSSSRRLGGRNWLQLESEAAGPSQTHGTYRNVFDVHCTSCTRSQADIVMTKGQSREYWMFYWGPGFLAAVWFGSSPTPPPPVSKLCLFLSLPVCCRSILLTGGGGHL